MKKFVVLLVITLLALSTARNTPTLRKVWEDYQKRQTIIEFDFYCVNIKVGHIIEDKKFFVTATTDVNEKLKAQVTLEVFEPVNGIIKKKLIAMLPGDLQLKNLLPSLITDRDTSELIITNAKVTASEDEGLTVNGLLKFTLNSKLRILNQYPSSIRGESIIFGLISRKPSKHELVNSVHFELKSNLEEFKFANFISGKETSLIIFVKSESNVVKKLDDKFLMSWNKKNTKVSLVFKTHLVIHLLNDLNLNGEIDFEKKDFLRVFGTTGDKWQNPFKMLNEKFFVQDVTGEAVIPLAESSSKDTYVQVKGQMRIFNRYVSALSEIGNRVGFVTLNLGKITIDEIKSLVSEIPNGIVLPDDVIKKFPLRFTIDKASFTYSNETGSTRSGRSVEKGYLIQTVSKIDLGNVISFPETNCDFKLSPNGFELNSEVVNGEMNLGPHIRIKEPKLEVHLKNNYQRVSVQALSTIFGVNLKINSTFRMIRSDLEWSFISYVDEKFRMSNIYSFIKDTPFDSISLERPQLVISTFGETINDPFHSTIEIRKGVNFYGKFKVDQFKFLKGISTLTGIKVPITLFAHFGDDEVYRGRLIPSKVNLGAYFGAKLISSRFMESNPLALEFALQPMAVALKGGVTVHVPGGSPLVVTLRLQVEELQAVGAGSMIGKWENPFGISFLSVEDVSFQVQFNYALFATTGLPSGAGFGGRIYLPEINYVDVRVLFDVDIRQSLLIAEIKRFSFDGILNMIKAAWGRKISTFVLHDLKFKVAPSTGRIGEIPFEKGLTLTGRLEVVGKDFANILVRASSSGVSINARVGEITFGPLTLSESLLRLECTSAEQLLEFSGGFTLLGISKQIYLKISLSEMIFSTSLESKYFAYGIEAKSIGGLVPSDFSLHVRWEIGMRLSFSEEIKSELFERIRKGFKTSAYLKNNFTSLWVSRGSFTIKLSEMKLWGKTKKLLVSVELVCHIGNVEKKIIVDGFDVTGEDRKIVETANKIIMLF